MSKITPEIDTSPATCTPHEHASLDAFVAKVEASGEDKRQTFLGTLEALKARFDRCIALGLTAEEAFDSFYREMVDGALEEGADHYTQAQRDAYAAEAVKQERERTGWQPIATAPKGMGAYLFLCGGVTVDGFIDATGVYCVRQEAGQGWRKMRRKPTHWQPLSPQPKDQP